MRREVYPNNLFSSSVTRVARATFPAGEGSFLCSAPPFCPNSPSTRHPERSVEILFWIEYAQNECDTQSNFFRRGSRKKRIYARSLKKFVLKLIVG